MIKSVEVKEVEFPKQQIRSAVWEIQLFIIQIKIDNRYLKMRKEHFFYFLLFVFFVFFFQGESKGIIIKLIFRQGSFVVE